MSNTAFFKKGQTNPVSGTSEFKYSHTRKKTGLVLHCFKRQSLLFSLRLLYDRFVQKFNMFFQGGMEMSKVVLYIERGSVMRFVFSKRMNLKKNSYTTEAIHDF